MSRGSKYISEGFKCINKFGCLKCPPDNDKKKVFCDTSTGLCYSETKKGIPHGFKYKVEEAEKCNRELSINSKYKLFGFEEDIDNHVKFLEKKEEELKIENINDIQLIDAAKSLNIDTKNTSKKELLDTVSTKIIANELQLKIPTISLEPTAPVTFNTETVDFSDYDIFLKSTEITEDNHKIFETVPLDLQDVKCKLGLEIQKIFQELDI